MSVVVAFYAIVFSGTVGTAIGMVAGYFGGWVDAAMMRLVEIQMSIPAIALALILAAALEPGLDTVVIVIVLTYWTWYARIIRGEILCLKKRDYVAFARVAGVSTGRIFVRHLLPNIVNTLLVLATLQVGQVIIFEASLSFLGLGIQPPDVSWGLMLADARQYITNAWWGITMPGLAIMLDLPRRQPVWRLAARPARSATAPAVTAELAPPVPSAPLPSAPLLSVRDLQTELHLRRGIVRAVDGIDLYLEAGETLGLVGESGSGKTMTSLSILRLLPKGSGRIAAGSIRTRRAGTDDAVRSGNGARDPRPADRDGLAGPDDLAEPRVHHW